MYRLIIIDDEENIADGIASLFPWNNIGFEVAATFTNAGDALDYLDRERVDVVMTDICMPDMDGLELTERLTKYQGVKAVIFSGFHDYQYMHKAICLKIEDYLLKPLAYDDIMTCFDKIKEKLDQGHELENRPASYYEEIIGRTRQYLKDNFQRANLSEAAEYTRLSPSYLSRIFKEYAGIGFAEELTRVRMEKAAQMLMNPEYKSYEIAYDVGYSNPKNFTRAFKAYFHVSPRDYRQGMRREEGAE